MFFRTCFVLLLFCLVASFSKADYIRLSDSNRYFQKADGTPFLPVGQNEGADWPYLVNIYPSLIDNPAFGGYDPKITRDYLDNLRDHGVNLLRIMTDNPQETARWLNPPHGCQMEYPVGSFTPGMVRFFDDLLALAEEYDIYLMLTPYDTYWMNYNFERNAYNQKNGGPVDTRHDFLTEAECFAYQKQRMAFLIDRYGDSDHIFAWDFMNELNIWWDSSEAEELAFTNKMTAWIAQYERQKWGKNHLICISTAGPEHAGDLGYAVYQHPNVDFPTTHFYYGDHTPPWPSQPSVANPETAPGSGIFDWITPVVQVNTGIKYALNQIPESDPRPFLDSESGPITYYGGGDSDPTLEPRPLPQPFDDTYFHFMTWAHLASGGAGGGLRWPMRYPLHTMTEGMQDYQQAMKRIAKLIPWNRFASENIDDQLVLSGVAGHDVLALGCGDGTTALCFLAQDARNTTGVISAASLTINGMTDGDYNVWLCDSFSGHTLEQTTATASAGALSLSLPDFLDTVVAVVRHQTQESAIDAKPAGIITAPFTGSGTGDVNTLTISADAWDPDGTVSRVEFYANYDDGSGKEFRYLGQDTTAPYAYNWDISGISDQDVDVSIDVYDDSGHAIRPAFVAYDIALESQGGDQTAPYGCLVFPPENGTIYQPGQTTLKADGWDDSSGVKRVQWFIQGTPGDPGAATNTWLGEDLEPPYELTVDLSAYAGTTRWVSMDVIDQANPENVAGPADLHGNITIVNGSSDLTTPTGRITQPAAGDVLTNHILTLEAEAEDLNSGVKEVRFYCYYDGSYHYMGTDTSPPWSLNWNAYGQINTSQKIGFTLDVVNNNGDILAPADMVGGVYYAVPDGDVFAPWAHLTAPLSYDTLQLPTTLTAIAGDETAMGSVSFYAGSEALGWNLLGTDDTGPYELFLDGVGIEAPFTTHIRLDARDAAGNLAAKTDIKGPVFVQPRETPVLTVTGSLTCQPEEENPAANIGTVWDAQDADGSLECTVSEKPAHFSLALTNTAGTLLGQPSATRDVAPGVYQLKITVEDNDGNQATGMVEVEVLEWVPPLPEASSRTWEIY